MPPPSKDRRGDNGAFKPCAASPATFSILGGLPLAALHVMAVNCEREYDGGVGCWDRF